MNQPKGRTRQEIEININERARKDHAFRQKLLSHPRQALMEFGLKVPEHAKIQVHEEKGDTWHLTLWKSEPGTKYVSDQELKDSRAAGCMRRCIYTNE